MRGIDPRLSVIEQLLKLPKYFYYFVKCFLLFKKPLSVIYHYIRLTLPRNNTITLHNGTKISLSDNPLDNITVFVIFVKEDYGKVLNESIVIDIGANIGVFSLYAAQCGAKKIYAYEPNSTAYSVLLRNIADNKLEDIIIPYRFAVSGSDDETVNIPLCSSPYNQMVRGNTNEDYEEVSTITLETILIQNKIDFVDLLKMDCEGAEYEIIFGLKVSIFSKLMEIRMEYHDGPVDELLSCFGKHNFLPIRFDRDSAALWVTKS
jgi:FkbM family methyltransferase